MVKSGDRAGAVAGITYKDETMVRKPAYQPRQQQPGDVRWRFMARVVHAIPLRGAVQGCQDGERIGSGGKRQLDAHRHNHPFMSPAVGGIAVGRPHPIAMPLLAEYFGAKVLGDRLVARSEHWPRRDDMLQQDRDQSARQGPGRPSALGKHPTIGRYVPLHLISHGAEQVGNGASPRGQDGREHQD
jgi:hypothetical protein